uniref:RING-type domain-containing protein n=1 Tax=Oryza brachyantha TaxID=4533 RepID=J3LJ38_ORYBR
GRGGDDEAASTCSICMEPWIRNGEHRICCIPCGHVYGRSCLEKWLNHSIVLLQQCPQCGERFERDHIINLYAPGINIWD